MNEIEQTFKLKAWQHIKQMMYVFVQNFNWIDMKRVLLSSALMKTNCQRNPIIRQNIFTWNNPKKIFRHLMIIMKPLFSLRTTRLLSAPFLFRTSQSSWLWWKFWCRHSVGEYLVNYCQNKKKHENVSKIFHDKLICLKEPQIQTK